MLQLFSALLLALAGSYQVGAWNGFYTPEYSSYTISEQTISVVFTLEV